jgi:hypothetical protein
MARLWIRRIKGAFQERWCDVRYCGRSTPSESKVWGREAHSPDLLVVCVSLKIGKVSMECYRTSSCQQGEPRKRDRPRIPIARIYLHELRSSVEDCNALVVPRPCGEREVGGGSFGYDVLLFPSPRRYERHSLDGKAMPLSRTMPESTVLPVCWADSPHLGARHSLAHRCQARHRR